MKKLTGKTIVGFTLTEVLITLLIIGVVSSIVIPALIANTQEQEYRVAWKKAYSDLNQATKQLVADNGGSLKGVFPDYKTTMMNKFLPYVSYVKACTYNQSFGNCWHRNGEYFSLSNYQYSWENTEGLVLNNGVLLRFDGRNPDASTCSHNSNNLNGICGWINVDINGFKKPNMAGKDIFTIWILENRLVPYGSLQDGISCAGDGRGCSALYLTQ